MNNIIVNGTNHPLFTEFVGLYKAKEYETSGGCHCPNFSKWLMCGRIKSYILECDGYYAN